MQGTISEITGSIIYWSLLLYQSVTKIKRHLNPVDLQLLHMATGSELPLLTVCWFRALVHFILNGQSYLSLFSSILLVVTSAQAETRWRLEFPRICFYLNTGLSDTAFTNGNKVLFKSCIRGQPTRGSFYPSLSNVSLSVNVFCSWREPFYQDGTEGKEGNPCPSQSWSQSKSLEGQESHAERHPEPQKEDMNIIYPLASQDTVAPEAVHISLKSALRRNKLDHYALATESAMKKDWGQ